MCERLLRVTGNKSETLVVVNGVGGGLGHMVRSTGLEVTYIATDAPLRRGECGTPHLPNRYPVIGLFLSTFDEANKHLKPNLTELLVV